MKGLGDYTIPPINKFAADGDPKTLGEIYAYGFRNAHRLSWDLTDGTMFASDIGMNHIEEINIVHNGNNYGWMKREGLFENGVTRPGGALNQLFPLPAEILDGRTKDEFTYPVAMYDHNDGQAVTGGFAYHGRIPALRGKFVFGDIVRGRLFAADLAAMKKADDGIPQTVAPVEEIQLYVRDAGGNRTYVTFRELVEATNGATRHPGGPAHQPQPRRGALHHVEAGRHDPDARSGFGRHDDVGRAPMSMRQSSSCGRRGVPASTAGSVGPEPLVCHQSAGCRIVFPSSRSRIMRNIPTLVVGIALVVAIAGCTQQPTGVAAAAEAMGTTNLNTIRVFRAADPTFAFGQAATPGERWPRFDAKTYAVAVDYQAPAMRLEMLRAQGEHPPHGGGAQPFAADQRTVQLVSGMQAWTEVGAQPVAQPWRRSASALRQVWLTPHGVIKAALTSGATANGNVITLNIEGRDVKATLNDQNLVDRVEYLTTNAVVGDVPVEITYSDYADFGGIKFPTHIVEKQDGFETLDVNIKDVKPNAAVSLERAGKRGPGAGAAGGAERRGGEGRQMASGRSTPPTRAASPWSSRITS